MPKSNIWVRIALANLAIVALVGCIMRYKIGFELPFFDQKHLQEAHSHFAFTGWISHTLYFLLVFLFRTNLPSIREKRYTWLIISNLLCAYGMLGSFWVQGYAAMSIFFSTLSILTGYIFAFYAYRDANRLSSFHPGKNWIKAALLFSVLSSFGTFQLSYMMATRQFDQTLYLGSIFFFLHFQYNGWFLFACMGLFLDKIKGSITDHGSLKMIFWLFFVAGIPAYFLSTLWAKLPVWLYVGVVAAAFLQVVGWTWFVSWLKKDAAKLSLLFSKTTLRLFLVVGLALTLKLGLQLSSTIPVISKLAFGFRPIVIAYLHLVLLLIITLFLLTYLYSGKLMQQGASTRKILAVFAGAAILNETVLAIQGIGAFSYTVIPFVREALFLIALVLFLSASFLFITQFSSPKA